MSNLPWKSCQLILFWHWFNLQLEIFLERNDKSPTSAETADPAIAPVPETETKEVTDESKQSESETEAGTDEIKEGWSWLFYNICSICYLFNNKYSATNIVRVAISMHSFKQHCR